MDVQQKVNERGEGNYNERMEDVRLLRLEIKRLKEEIAFLTTDTRNLGALKKEVSLPHICLTQECLSKSYQYSWTEYLETCV